MIKWKKSKKVHVKYKNFDGFIKKIIVLRVCDRCGLEEEARWGAVKKGRESRGQDTDYCYNCSQRFKKFKTGPAYKKWKHGLTYNGYVRITVDRKRILEHVHVMTKKLGRPIKDSETIHHIDMDKTNNDPNNLYLFESQSEHQRCHAAMENCGFLLFNKMIWFDWENKKYVLNLTAEPKFEKIEYPEVKIYNKKSGSGDGVYACYLERLSSNKWRWRRYHTLLAEQIMKRRLYVNECVHHVDGNKLNNLVENLCILTKVEHGSCHCSLQIVVSELYKIGVIGFEKGLYFIKEESSNKSVKAA